MYQTNWRKQHLSLKEQYFKLKQENESLSYQITQLKVKLEKSEIKIQSLESLLPYGIWLCNARGEVKYISESFLKLKGITLKDCKDYGWLQYVPANHQKEILQKWKKCLESGDIWEEIYEIEDKTGVKHLILSRGCPSRNAANHIIGWVGVYISITPQEQAAFLLKQKNK